jgi:hypothetical protein
MLPLVRSVLAPAIICAVFVCEEAPMLPLVRSVLAPAIICTIFACEDAHMLPLVRSVLAPAIICAIFACEEAPMLPLVRAILAPVIIYTIAKLTGNFILAIRCVHFRLRVLFRTFSAPTDIQRSTQGMRGGEPRVDRHLKYPAPSGFNRIVEFIDNV